MNNLRWRVYCPKGELVAATRYAIIAARVALAEGAGSRILHEGRLLLTLCKSDADLDALGVADWLLDARRRGSLKG